MCELGRPVNNLGNLINNNYKFKNFPNLKFEIIIFLKISRLIPNYFTPNKLNTSLILKKNIIFIKKQI